MPIQALETRRNVLLGAGAAFAQAASPARTQAPHGFDSFVPHPSHRAVVVSDVVHAPLARLWWAWTTSQGMRALGWESRIRLRIGGPYEVYFDPTAPAGLRGGEGLKVLSFLPSRMLSTEWNAPPRFPTIRTQRTWIVVEFHELEASSTRLTITHLGWGEGGDWPQVYAYFERAWPVVVARCQDRLG